jgi:uncharacterized protein
MRMCIINNVSINNVSIVKGIVMHDEKPRAVRSLPPASSVNGRQKPCPLCGAPASPLLRPFCSSMCANQDLARWLGEAYRIPADDAQTPGAD